MFLIWVMAFCRTLTLNTSKPWLKPYIDIAPNITNPEITELDVLNQSTDGLTRLIFYALALGCFLIVSLDGKAADVSETVTPYIIGGNTAGSTDWPWMTALVYKSDVQVFCGGSLIAKDWVLTAAHCVVGKTGAALEALINRANVLSTQGERIAIKQTVIHPAYNSVTQENDIALLKLATSAQADPIETLPDFSSQDNPGQNAVALGWGNTLTYREFFPNDLQQVILPIVSNATCQEHMTGIQDDMLCAGLAEGGKDTCKGDSGGPLIVFDTESNSWRQAAITSFGKPVCAAKGYYGVYTRLKLYKSFITDTICAPSQIPSPPLLNLTVNNTQVTASWNPSATTTTSYRLNYAPYPDGNPINSLAPEAPNQYSVNLPKGSAYFVGITAYNGNCRSRFSNIRSFTVQ